MHSSRSKTGRPRARATGLLALWIALLPVLAAPTAGATGCALAGQECCCVDVPPPTSAETVSCCTVEDETRVAPVTPEPECSCRVDGDTHPAPQVALGTGTGAASDAALAARLKAGAEERAFAPRRSAAPDAPADGPSSGPPDAAGELRLLRSAGPGPARSHVLGRGVRRVLAELSTARL